MPPPHTTPAFVRFWERADLSGDCWLWKGSITPAGYGQFGKVYAHRFAYEALIGPIPEGLQIDHLCFNRACVNPVHLEPVTQRENMRRSGVLDYQREKTHCNRGHAFTVENTQVDSGGERHCRACQRIYRSDHRARKREAVSPTGERG